MVGRNGTRVPPTAEYRYDYKGLRHDRVSIKMREELASRCCRHAPAVGRIRTLQRGVIGVIHENGRFLVIRRSQRVVAPGLLCFPGGGIQAGEGEETALQRELDEELALRQVHIIRRIWRSVTPTSTELTWWLTRLPQRSPIVPNPAEVAEVFWDELENLISRPDLLPSNRLFLEACQRGDVNLEIEIHP